MLYLVSTPIGNLGDISERAKETLQKADLIACEDTRTTKSLLTLLGIRYGALTAYHEHNADKVRPQLIEKLKQGVTIALVSDAGTPLISDPGYRLVRDCRQHQIAVTTVPGANAVLSALQLSGLPSDHFYFGGFLPPKTTARKQTLKEVQFIPATLIFYETPHRIEESLKDILDVYGDRIVSVVREITKKFEEAKTAPVSVLLDEYRQNGVPKGELVIVVDRKSQEETEIDENKIDELILTHITKNGTKETASIVSEITGLPKKQIYKRVVELTHG